MRARSLFDIDRSTAANDPRSSASFSAPKNSSTYSSEYASGFSGSAASQLVVPPSPRYESNVGQAPRRWDEPRLSTRIQFAHIPPSSIGRSDLFLEGGSGLGHRRRNASRKNADGCGSGQNVPTPAARTLEFFEIVVLLSAVVTVSGHNLDRGIDFLPFGRQCRFPQDRFRSGATRLDRRLPGCRR